MVQVFLKSLYPLAYELYWLVSLLHFKIEPLLSFFFKFILFLVLKGLSFISSFVSVDTGEEPLAHRHRVLSNLIDEAEDFEPQTGLVDCVFSKL